MLSDHGTSRTPPSDSSVPSSASPARTTKKTESSASKLREMSLSGSQIPESLRFCGSLQKLDLSGNRLKSLLESKHIELDWSARFRIGLGAARGLAWLDHGCHRPPILHQDVSSSVILVDARIVDSGLAARLMVHWDNDSCFMAGGLGEFGYVAPEYTTTFTASLKGDVYARKAVGSGVEGFEGSLVDWVNQLGRSGRLADVFDEDTRGKGNDEEILKFFEVACLCVAPMPELRWSVFRAYRSLKPMAERRGYSFTEQDDDFPLIFDTQENETV